MSMLLPVLKKELKYYAASPMIYVAGAVFLGLAGYFFYTNLIMLLLLQGSGVEVNLWEFTINDIRLLVMLLIPVVSMRMLAEEKRLGTLELLCTSPLHDGDIVLGKYCAGMCVISLLVCATLLFPFLFSIFYPLDHGQLFGAYLGLMLMSFALMAAGIFWSSITESQLVASIATIGFTFLLWFMDQYAAIDLVSGHLSFSLLSLQKRFYNFNRGVVSLRDTVYFCGFAVLFIMLAIESLKQRKHGAKEVRLPLWGQINVKGFSFALHAAAYTLCFVLCIALPGIPNKRFDITAGRVHSPSPATAQALAQLTDKLTLSIGCEGLQKYQYEDFLDQLTGLSPYFKYRLLTLERNPVAAALMNISSGGEGVAEYRGRKKNIEKVNEDSVVAAVLELTRDMKKKVRIITRHASAGSKEDYTFRNADRLLSDEGFVLEFDHATEIDAFAPDTGLVILRDIATDLSPEMIKKLEAFFENDGRALMLVSSGKFPNIESLLKSYNVDLGNDLIIDRQHGGSGLDELTPVVFLNQEHPAAAGCKAPAVFNRARSVQVGTGARRGYAVSILCSSGRSTWAETDLASAGNGTAIYTSGIDSYGPVAVGVSIEKRDDPAGNKGGRMIVLGSSSFMADGYTELLGNGSFAKSLVAWLVDRRPLPQVSVSKPVPPAAKPIRVTDAQSRIFFWIVVVLVPSLFIAAGIAVILLQRFRH
ncbi:MAG: Gldg family protein [Pseudomonadota bacterium]